MVAEQELDWRAARCEQRTVAKIGPLRTS